MAFHDTFHGMVSVSIRYRVASAERGVGERVPKVPSRRDSERFRDVAKTLQENRPPKKLFERDFLHAQSYSIEPYRSQHPECRCHDVRSWCATQKHRRELVNLRVRRCGGEGRGLKSESALACTTAHGTLSRGASLRIEDMQSNRHGNTTRRPPVDNAQRVLLPSVVCRTSRIGRNYSCLPSQW